MDEPAVGVSHERKYISDINMTFHKRPLLDLYVP
jgi:hypothetical protein